MKRIYVIAFHFELTSYPSIELAITDKLIHSTFGSLMLTPTTSMFILLTIPYFSVTLHVIRLQQVSRKENVENCLYFDIIISTLPVYGCVRQHLHPLKIVFQSTIRWYV